MTPVEAYVCLSGVRSVSVQSVNSCVKWHHLTVFAGGRARVPVHVHLSACRSGLCEFLTDWERKTACWPPLARGKCPNPGPWAREKQRRETGQEKRERLPWWSNG